MVGTLGGVTTIKYGLSFGGNIMFLKVIMVMVPQL